ncbi:ArsR/SmtB family transcription factor [Chelatococcus sp. GCM10030263]|uniref:ArsR/SmtB family transcription factor n=1 Tax=Chelatococcus sp. GCM10030263 TaxID=3273387 RepID=UPI00361D85E1
MGKDPAKFNGMIKYRDDALDAVFHALADPTRRAIIRMLAQREHSIGELVPSFPISFVAVSNHVKALEKAGLIRREIKGRHHICKLDGAGLNAAYRWLAAYERFWNESLDALEEVLEDMKKEAPEE